MWAHFDTSALVKRYIDEVGRREVLQLLRKHKCVVSAVLPVELRSVLRRRVTEGTIEAAPVAGSSWRRLDGSCLLDPCRGRS